jgi:hypothetical protein
MAAETASRQQNVFYGGVTGQHSSDVSGTHHCTCRKQGFQNCMYDLNHNDELYSLYSSLNTVRVIKEDEVGGTCGMNEGWERYLHGFSWEVQR